MKRAAVVLALLLPAAVPARAQPPTVSPALERLLGRDTVVTAWLFAAPDRTLDEVAALVAELGGTVRRRSRWLHAVSAHMPTAGLAAARRRLELRHLQPVARFRGREPLPQTPAAPPPRAAAAAAQPETYGPSAMPFRRLNLFPLVERGLLGAGVTIALLDTGFETEDAAFAGATVTHQFDFVFDDSIVRNEPADEPTASRHGTQVWSLLAGNLPGQIIGVAPEATYLLAKTEDVRSETRVEEDNFVAALEWADSLGARVISASLSYLGFDDGFSYAPGDLNGDVAVTTVAADAAATRGITVLAAVGNSGASGFRSLTTPADGDSVIAVGAEDSLGVLQVFSSRGPTADGRLKPDLLAPGTAVFVRDPFSATGFSRVAGTSFSTPLAAGAAALLRQTHPLLGPSEILEALRRTGSNRARPDSTTGWGRPDAAAAATFPRGIVVATPADTLFTAATPTFEWSTPDVPADALPLRYRLAVALDSGLAFPVLDTTLAETALVLLTAQRPGTRLFFRLSATAADGVQYEELPGPAIVMPAWTRLLTLDDPAGTAIREPRPIFRWASLQVAAPPGPFRYDVEIVRADRQTVEARAAGLEVTQFQPEEDLERNTPYRWRVITRLGSDSVVVESQGTFLIIDDSVPTTTLLFQNFPNPFPQPSSGRRSTCIWFDLAVEGRVTLDVLDIRGHIVRRLLPGGAFPARLPPGRYGRPAVDGSGQCDPRLEWDGTADGGSGVPRGIYLIKLATPQGVFFKRVVFLGGEP